MAPERAAKAVILDWCRSGKRGIGQPAMRLQGSGVNERKLVVNLAKSEPVPGGYDWETRDKVEADGATWAECLEQLWSTHGAEGCQ